MIKKLKTIVALSILFLLNGCHLNFFEELNCIYPSHFTEQEKIAIAVLDAYVKKGKKEDIIFLGAFDEKDYENNQHLDFYEFLNNFFGTEIKDARNSYRLPKEYVRSVKTMRYVIKDIFTDKITENTNKVTEESIEINVPTIDKIVELEMERDKKTHRVGFSIYFDTKIINDYEAIIRYGLMFAPLEGSGFTVTVKKEQGCWVVDKKTKRDQWIS